ncbi:MAG: MATE family efflux transporter [Treponema sp.]|nr:MATE family efflux transporter [Treponema sp.]
MWRPPAAAYLNRRCALWCNNSVKNAILAPVTRTTKNATTISNAILEGPVWRGLLSFFFPIMLGTFFQQLYNTVDAIVVGQFLGKQALVAVSGGSSTYINLLVGFFTGLASGATIIISQFYGAHHERELHRAIHTALALSVWGGVVLTAIGILITPFAMRMISTPADILHPSIVYLRIFFTGVLPMLVYNMGSGILHAFGDSKSPFIILVIGCIANIALDLLCVALFKWGVAGAAWATVISQTVCMILTINKLAHQENRHCQFHITKMRFAPHLLRRMIVVGLPAGVQSSLYTISNLIIQSNINSFGTDTAAAWAAYGRFDSIFWMTASSFGIAITTFAGQNYGARKFKRIKQATREGLLIMSGAALLCTAIFYAVGQYVFLLFTKDEAVIAHGMHMLHVLAPFFIVFVPIEVLSGTIRGAGDTFKPMIITMLGICALRVVWLFTAVPLHNTLATVMACYPLTWIVTSVAFFIYYARGKWLHMRE